MPKPVVTNNFFFRNSIKNIVPLSTLVPLEVIEEMREEFRKTNQGQTTFYDCNAKDLFTFLKDIEGYKPNPGIKKGIAFRIGRQIQTNNFNVGFEVVEYVRPLLIKPIKEHNFLTIDNFFGRLSPDFSRRYHSQEERTEFNNHLIEHDFSKVEFALIGYNTFIQFAGKESEFSNLRIEFIRNGKGQITVVLFRLDSENQPIKSEAADILGIYLDDHDLLP